MAIRSLNHAVLYVRDAERTARFWTDVLDFEVAHAFPGGVFLRAPRSTNDHDLALFSIGEAAGGPTAGRSTVGLYHLAWEVERLGDLEQLGARLEAAGALVGASDHGASKSLYAKDPDGIEFEVCWCVPAEQVTEGMAPVRPLDLPAELARFGPDAKSRLAHAAR
ncbi:MAG: VOC family protein [Actinobacteria bacterium]|nr:VOC family protein [Actinomycetota bacterium]